jgi:peptidoglycan/LPS O-acetylase OafA/YrhL
MLLRPFSGLRPGGTNVAVPRRSPASAQGARLAYVPALDGVRALAVAAVLLYRGDFSWPGGGYLGVDAFFVLSRFLITSSVRAEWRGEGRIALAGPTSIGHR